MDGDSLVALAGEKEGSPGVKGAECVAPCLPLLKHLLPGSAWPRRPRLGLAVLASSSDRRPLASKVSTQREGFIERFQGAVLHARPSINHGLVGAVALFKMRAWS